MACSDWVKYKVELSRGVSLSTDLLEGAPADELGDAEVALARLSPWERITLTDESRIQKALTRMNAKVGLLSLPSAALRERVEDIEKAIAFYRDAKFENNPKKYFQSPKSVPTVSEQGRCRLSRGEVLDIYFPSGYKAQEKSYAKEFKACHENRLVHARHWRHPAGEELGTIVALHGWRMGDSRLSALTLIPGYFFRLGLNVVLLDLPYHGRRSPSHVQPGSYFPSANVVRTNEGFAQAIHDLRSLSLWLEERNTAPIGVLGLSLGGYLASLWASLDELACVMCISPMVDMAEVALRIIGQHRDMLSGKANIYFDSLRQEFLQQAFAVHSPLTYQPRVAQNARLILAGVADEIIPAWQPEMLSKHWGNCPIHWITSRHLDHAIQSTTFKVLKDFLSGLGLAHPELLRISHRF